ncbi:hypothetical protein C8R45DRAFT_999392 [Mycena sanguinolenta]|nr:hypothetical protein C8R45DRAFT_999392 [Mycena sanguinolenta]
MSAPSNASPQTDDGALYHSFAALKKFEVQECKNACSTCLAKEQDLGRPMRRCAKCQGVFYCSKECQTRDWPVHKQMCGEAGVAKRLSKLAKALISCPPVLLQLQSSFMLAFDLLQHPRCDELLYARVDIAVEPSSLVDLAAILLGKEPPRDGVQGMVQINRFTPATAADISSAEREAAWRRQRAKADSDGFEDDAIGIMDICQADGPLAVAFPVRIPSKMKPVVKGWSDCGCTVTSSTGEKTTIPYTVENCLQLINMHIRADTKNELLLRTQMRPSDIQIIHDAATNPHTVSALNLQAKLAREHIYQSMHQTFMERLKAVTGSR